MNNQKGFAIIPIIIIAVVIIAGGVGGYLYLKNKNFSKPVICTQEAKQCSDGSYVSRIPPKCDFAECPSTTIATQQQTTSTQSITTPMIAIDNKLTGCIQAGSIKDYLLKEKISIGLSDWPEGWTEELKPSIKTNFPDAKIYYIGLPLGGGDYGSFTFINSGNQYCKLTEDNLKAIFAPINNKEEALEYYFFVKRDIGVAWDQSIIYIFKESDYNNETIKDHSRFCDKTLQAKLNETTKIDIVENGYLLKVVGFSYIGKTVFFKNFYLIRKDGEIRALKESEVLLDCGGGAFF